jgi:hypothetical protein
MAESTYNTTKQEIDFAFAKARLDALHKMSKKNKPKKQEEKG